MRVKFLFGISFLLISTVFLKDYVLLFIGHKMNGMHQ